MFRFLSLLSLTLIVLSACEPKPQPLRALTIPFAGESVFGDINGDEYRYFRYESREAALQDKLKVSPDGKKIDGKKIGWDGPVHFFHLAKRIVIYVGDNEETLKQIESVFGPRFAGTLEDSEDAKDSEESED